MVKGDGMIQYLYTTPKYDDIPVYISVKYGQNQRNNTNLST